MIGKNTIDHYGTKNTKPEKTIVNKKMTLSGYQKKPEEMSLENLEVLEESKSKKSPGMDKMRVELLKYGDFCFIE
jgi:hypothetical protein